MEHKDFQKIAEDYAAEHGFKMFVAVHKNNTMHTFGDDVLQTYFQGLMDDRKLASEWLKKRNEKLNPLEDLRDKLGRPFTEKDIVGGRRGENKCG